MAEAHQAHDGRVRLTAALEVQSAICASNGSALYAGLMARAADDVRAGGPVAAALDGHEHDPPGAALVLRLFAAVHRLVLEQRVPELARYYPSVGGTPSIDRAWTAFQQVVAEHREAIRPWLDRPPQTNEVGRAAALLGGLLHVGARWGLPVRLTEIGASAGLNLRADQFRVETGTGSGWGPPDSPVRLGAAWVGCAPPLAPGLRVIERSGCDLAPVDPGTVGGRLTLTSYVWADDLVRLHRLRGALEVAARVPAEVEPASAAAFLRRQELSAGSVLVVWHSVMWQYLTTAERDQVRARVDELGAGATLAAPFAHLRLEPGPAGSGTLRHEVRLGIWPSGSDRLLGSAPPHGVPVQWDAGPESGTG